MSNVKRNFYFIVMLFFFTTPSFLNLWAEESAQKADQQKAEGQQEQTPTITIKGSKMRVVLDEKKPTQQKIENQKKQVPKQGQPQIVFDTAAYDIGDVWEGDEVVHTFTIKNTGTAELNINQVRAG